MNDGQKDEHLQLETILLRLEELKAKEPKAKDKWDKASILGQLIAGILLVALGLYVTWNINDAQIKSSRQIADLQTASSIQAALSQKQSSKDITDAQAETARKIQEAQDKTAKQVQEAQAGNSQHIAEAQIDSQLLAQRLSLEVQKHQQEADYLGKLISASDPDVRLGLLSNLDLAVDDPSYAIKFALRFTKPVVVRADICGGRVITNDREALKGENANLNATAFALLQRLRPKGLDVLKEASFLGYQPDASVADAVLGNESKIFFRLSQIDDFADVFINDTQLDTYKFGRESGWIDVTDKVIRNSNNRLSVRVRNSLYEGTGVRFEVRAGAEQYDRVVLRHDWTGQGPAFWILLDLSVDARGVFHLNGDSISVEEPDRGFAKPCPGAAATQTVASKGTQRLQLRSAQ